MPSFSYLFFQFFSTLFIEPSLMYLNQLLNDFFFFYIWKDYNLFALFLSSFHFCSHVFHLPLSLLSNISQMYLVSDWHVLRFIYSCLWHLLVKQTLSLPLPALLEVKLIETKLGLMDPLLRKNPNQKADRRCEPRNQAIYPSLEKGKLETCF